MKYLDEFREPRAARRLLDEIKATVTRPWALMEVCGGQTHSLLRNGLDELLPDQVEMIHGPGCPVCVTPLEMIDRALAIAALPNTIVCSFGDMLRVPGSKADLFQIRSRGGDVRVVYSPLDSLQIARDNPNRQVVFFGVGFETTAPANAMAVYQAHREQLTNFSMLVSHVLVPPAIEAILTGKNCRVQGFLAAGHVCSVMGTEQYGPLVERYRIPIVITGFEPLDLLSGILAALRQLETGQARLENAYARAVRSQGNPAAREMLSRVFEVTERNWRGIGTIARSGWKLSGEFADYDAERRFGVGHIHSSESHLCQAGQVLQGLLKPHQCAAFGKECTPRSPLGATMVSSEGACAAYFHSGRYPS